MERMRGGDVFDQIMKKNKFNENEARKLAKVLLQAVAYFHEQGIAHRYVYI
jgi:serine/threonine protein kinase